MRLVPLSEKTWYRWRMECTSQHLERQDVLLGLTKVDGFIFSVERWLSAKAEIR